MTLLSTDILLKAQLDSHRAETQRDFVVLDENDVVKQAGSNSLLIYDALVRELGNKIVLVEDYKAVPPGAWYDRAAGKVMPPQTMTPRVVGTDILDLPIPCSVRIWPANEWHDVDDGSAELDLVQVGTYEVMIRAPGYVSTTVTVVR